MAVGPSLSYDDLELAFHWVSGAQPMMNSAFVSRATGQVFLASMAYDTEDELPEDIDDATRYISVPHKNDLDLGRDLVMRFVEERVPGEFDRVWSFFHKRGAYGRFKDFLEERGLLDDWHEYERLAVEQALRAWAEEEGIAIRGQGRRSGA